jgi:hypothetical protein
MLTNMPSPGPYRWAGVASAHVWSRLPSGTIVAAPVSAPLSRARSPLRDTDIGPPAVWVIHILMIPVAAVVATRFRAVPAFVRNSCPSRTASRPVSTASPIAPAALVRSASGVAPVVGRCAFTPRTRVELSRARRLNLPPLTLTSISGISGGGLITSAAFDTPAFVRVSSPPSLVSVFSRRTTALTAARLND